MEDAETVRGDDVGVVVRGEDVPCDGDVGVAAA